MFFTAQTQFQEKSKVSRMSAMSKFLKVVITVGKLKTRITFNTQFGICEIEVLRAVLTRFEVKMKKLAFALTKG